MTRDFPITAAGTGGAESCALSLFGPRRLKFLTGIILFVGLTNQPASAQTAAIVGTGAARCSKFTAAIETRPAEEKEYFAWAQGYMSGILLSARRGVDEGLQLAPENFPILAQLEFMRAYCERFPDASYSDGVETLYKGIGGTAVK